MRNFNEADKEKKRTRKLVQNIPGNLSEGILKELENLVKVSLVEGYLPCPVAWGIAKKYNVPKMTVGEIVDRLGIRVTNCQLGCFKVEKTPYDTTTHEYVDGEVVNIIDSHKENGALNCIEVFELAAKHKLKPITVANEMNARGLKISCCQLGCF